MSGHLDSIFVSLKIDEIQTLSSSRQATCIVHAFYRGCRDVWIEFYLFFNDRVPRNQVTSFASMC